jgi:hypothetical protein
MGVVAVSATVRAILIFADGRVQIDDIAPTNWFFRRDDATSDRSPRTFEAVGFPADSLAEHATEGLPPGTLHVYIETPRGEEP